MTAPLANTAVNAPLAGAASLVGGVAGQGAATTGFDALLASLFGGGVSGAATNVAESLFGPAPAAASDDEQTAVEGEAEQATPAASTDAQALAAMLTIPAGAPQPIPVAETTAEPQAQAPAGQPAAAFVAVAPQEAMAPAPSTIAQPQGPATASVDTAVVEAPAPALPVERATPAAADVAQEAAATVAKPAAAAEAKAAAIPAQPAKPHLDAPRHVSAAPPAPKPVEAPVAPAPTEAGQPVLAEAAAEAAPAPATPAKERPARGARSQAAQDGAAVQATPASANVAIHAEHAATPATPAVPAQPAHAETAEPKLEIEAAAIEAAPKEAQAPEADTPETQAAPTQAAGSTEQSRAPTHSAVVRGSPETVAQLSAQILKKLEARSTRFDLELNPVNLGRVDVRIEIGAHGRMSAAMTFENPQAAQELRSKAHELQRALEQAGFDLSGGVTFDVAQDRGQHQGHGLAQQQQDAAPWRGRAFQAALSTAGEADVAAAPQPYLERRASGVDVRI